MTSDEEVMQWLMAYCKKHNIYFVCNTDLDPKDKSYSYRFPRIIYLNDNHPRLEKPFVFAHEIGHAMCAREDLVTENATYSEKEHNECFANKFAIRLLLKYCRDNDIAFSSYYSFAESFGIPKRLQYLLEEVIHMEAM